MCYILAFFTETKKFILAKVYSAVKERLGLEPSLS